MPKNDIPQLIEKLNNGTLTPSEAAFLHHWYIGYSKTASSTADPDLLEENLTLLDTEVMAALGNHGFAMPLKPKRSKIWPKMVAAASIVLAIACGMYLMKGPKMAKQPQPNAAHITPGGNKAWLTLADGSRISLGDAADGQLAEQAGITITKSSEGTLVYTINDLPEKSVGNSYNVIETPRGGQYQINLPDGSKVCLNAETRIKFPISFASLAERRVELTGEAYFEVAKSNSADGTPGKPFIVTSKNQQVKVLGTHFNVSAYNDDPTTETTLLEGAVSVSSKDRTVHLVPGQQSKCNAAMLKTGKADTERVMAWKYGQFMFDGEPLTEVMKKVSRWYNVDVRYNGNFSGVMIAGSVSKFANINDLLEILSLAGNVDITIQGKILTINPKSI